MTTTTDEHPFTTLAKQWRDAWSFRHKPYLIGQAPSRTGDPDRPCTGRFGEKLAELVDADTDYRTLRFYTFFNRRNVLNDYPGSADGKGDLFPIDEARSAADALVRSGELDGHAVVLVGKTTTARAFRMEGPYFEWQERDGFIAAPFPHPSGINTFWNDPDNEREAAEFLRRVIRGDVPGKASV